MQAAAHLEVEVDQEVVEDEAVNPVWVVQVLEQ